MAARGVVVFFHVCDDPNLVQQRRIAVAEVVCCGEVLSRDGQITQSSLLHAEEHLREVRALEESCGGTVRGNSLVRLAFCGESVREADPSWAEVRVHQRGFGEV